jgi:hypothetical protein
LGWVNIEKVLVSSIWKGIQFSLDLVFLIHLSSLVLAFGEIGTAGYLQAQKTHRIVNQFVCSKKESSISLSTWKDKTTSSISQSFPSHGARLPRCVSLATLTSIASFNHK